MRIQNYIDDTVVRLNSENKREAKASPSSLGKCLRQLTLMERAAPAWDFTAQQLRVFRAGHLFEEFVVSSLPSSLIAATQIPCSYRGMSGTADLILHLANGKKRLVDVKSVHSMKFNYLDKEGVDEGYATQLTFYHTALKQMPEWQDLDDTCTIFYVEKECILTKEVDLKPADYLPKVNAKLDAIEAARKSKDLPPEKELDWQCFSVSKRNKTVKIWCRWIEHCPGICLQYHAACAGLKIEPDKRIKKQEKNNEQTN